MRAQEPQLSVIVPTRNESANIHLLLDTLANALTGITTEVIIVDDSDDDTPSLVEQAASEASDMLRIRLLHRNPGVERQGGLATAVSLGIRRAHAKYFAVIDADLQHPPERLRTLYEEAIATNADIVMATRYRAGGSYEGLDGFSRRLFSVGLKWVAKILFPDQLLRVSDPLGGFFLVRRAIVKNVVLRPIGYKISLEILIRCKWARLAEVPYHFHARNAGESKANFKQGIMALQHMARLVYEVPAAARFWKFCAVGASGVIVNLVLFWLAMQAHSSAWFAWIAATEFSILTNFMLNSLFTWSDQNSDEVQTWSRRALRYHAAVAPSTAISLAFFLMALEFHQRPFIAQMIGVAAGLLISYTLARRIVFSPQAKVFTEAAPLPAFEQSSALSEQDDEVLTASRTA
jgi:putative flippase GtrA